jgi:hypothetical protein
VAAEIVPDPSPEEREVLLAALAELDARPASPPSYRSSWRLAGLADDLDEDV